jgi:diguanylate cyclase (GGDEF)-like protein/PAS domain S-box-containing protein
VLELTGEARFLQLASNSPEFYWLIDVESQQFTYVSNGYEQIWGRRVEALYADNRDWLQFIDPEDRGRIEGRLLECNFGGMEEKFRILRPDGSVRWLLVRNFPVNDEAGETVSVGGVATDITALVGPQTTQAYFAHFDALTALPNQLMFYNQARRLLALAQRKDLQLGIMVIDIDRFREVNQMLGHLYGDQLLRQIALRLTDCFRQSDILGRIGNDIFAALLPDVGNDEQAVIVSQRVIEALAAPVMVEGREVFVTASIGVTRFPQDRAVDSKAEVHELVSRAELASRHAKAAGRNSFRFYSPQMHDGARDRLFLETDLHNAALRGEFMLYYQPKVSCATGMLTGAEALIRWNHPTRGIVPPDQFIPLLEETGLIVQVGRWILEAACRQVVAWREAGLVLPSVSVNLSARQLETSTLADDVAHALQVSGLDPASLDLEITESMLMNDADRAIHTLNTLKKTGVTLSLDDFGTGYSSLAYLKRFPLDALKVDRSFVQDIAADSDDASITRAVITMAHHLKLKVVAEGVETTEQLALLISHQCDMIQGYFFSRPLSVDDFAQLLRSGKRLPTHLLRSTTRQPMALFVAVDGFDEVVSMLTRDGHRVCTAADVASAQLWLAGNLADVVVCGSPSVQFDAVAMLHLVSQQQPQCERLLLVEDQQWHQQQVADLSGSTLVDRVLHLPIEPVALRELVEETLERRHISDEYGRLSHAVQIAERELLRVEEDRQRLLKENSALRAQGDHSYAILQEVISGLPWPVIGVDEDDLLALHNEAAMAAFAVRGLGLGDDLFGLLPEVADVGEGGGRVTIDDLEYQAWWRPLRVDGRVCGRLLLLQRG